MLLGMLWPMSLRDRVAWQRVLLVRAAVARDVVPDALTAAGASVTVVDAYRTVIPADAVEQAQAVFGTKLLPDAVVFTSGSTVTHLLDVLREAGITFPRASLRLDWAGDFGCFARCWANRCCRSRDRFAGWIGRCLRSFACELVARPCLIVRVAFLFDDAIDAAGFAGDADGAAMQDQLVAEVDPVTFRNDLY